jgi:hypothetical protein
MKPRLVILLFFVCAGLLLAGTVLAAVLLPELPIALAGRASSGCSDAGESNWAAIAATEGPITIAFADGKWKATRTLTYALAGASAGSVRACAGTGHVALAANPGEGIVVQANVTGQGATEQDARSAAQALTPHVVGIAGSVAASEPHHGWNAFGPRAGLSLRVLVPPAELVDARLEAGTGSVSVDGVRLGSLDANSGTGQVHVAALYAEGQLNLRSGTGSVDARFAALGNATIEANAGTGNVRVAVPDDARHGYDVEASTGTGRVALDLSSLDVQDHHARFGPGDRQEARTSDYDARLVRVPIALRAGTGSIELTSS